MMLCFAKLETTFLLPSSESESSCAYWRIQSRVFRFSSSVLALSLGAAGGILGGGASCVESFTALKPVAASLLCRENRAMVY